MSHRANCIECEFSARGSDVEAIETHQDQTGHTIESVKDTEPADVDQALQLPEGFEGDADWTPAERFAAEFASFNDARLALSTALAYYIGFCGDDAALGAATREVWRAYWAALEAEINTARTTGPS